MNSDTTCPDCQGTGLDPVHHWPDGTAAACESCEGYGDLGSLPTWEQFHRFMQRGHFQVPPVCDEFLSAEPGHLENMRRINQILNQ